MNMQLMEPETDYPSAVQRRRVPPQQALRIALLPGEQVQIDSPDGGQCCELIMLDEYQGEARDRLDLGQAMAGAPILQAQLKQNRPSAQRLWQRLQSWGVEEVKQHPALHLDGDQLRKTACRSRWHRRYRRSIFRTAVPGSIG